MNSRINQKDFGSTYYDLKYIIDATSLWRHNLWKDKNIKKENLKELDFAQVLKETKTVLSATNNAILIALHVRQESLEGPKSFYTLGRVK